MGDDRSTTAPHERPAPRDVAPPDAGAFSYQPALDGIRAVAVTSVLLYHGGLRLGRAGFLGVDVFFVLSGFLITLLLLRELVTTERIDLRAFYARRARRLLPALFALLAVLSVYAFLFASPADRERIRSDGLASLFYVQNWHLIATGQSYFAQFRTPSPLRHMWSLAIEEQWYLLWPVLLTGLVWLVRGRRSRLIAATCVLAAGSACAMAVLFQNRADPSRVYYGTDTRAFELLIGAVLAMAWPAIARRRATAARSLVQIAGVAAGAFVLWMIYASSDASPRLYRGGLVLVAVATAGVIAAAMSRGPVRAVLSAPPLPSLGRISYGVYLWHWPIFLLLTPAKVGVGAIALFAVRCAATIVVSVLSFRLVEMPVRARRTFVTRRGFAWAPATALVVAASLAVGGSHFGFGTSRNTVDGAAIARYAAAARAAGRPPRPEAVRVFLVGDSVAFFLGFLGTPPELTDQVSIHGNPILGCGIARGDIVSAGVTHAPFPGCDTWPQTYEQAFRRDEPDVSVALVGAWEVYDRRIDGRLIKFGTPAMETYLRSELDRATSILTANGAPLVLLATPCFHIESGGTVTWGLAERNSDARIAWFNDLLRRYAAERPGRVVFLDLHALMCPNGRYENRIGGVDTRSDGMHFTKEGAALVWRWLVPQLRQLAAASPPYRARMHLPGSVSTTTPGGG